MKTEGYTYPYPRPMVTVDAVVFTVIEGDLAVLLIKRGRPPFLGMWALPGGFLDMDEELETAAARELAEETGVEGIRLEQFHTFGDVGRDPRGRVITIAYTGLADYHQLDPKAGDDAADVCWMPVRDMPRLSADHNLIIETAVRWMELRLAVPGGSFDLAPRTLSPDMLRHAILVLFHSRPC